MGRLHMCVALSIAASALSGCERNGPPAAPRASAAPRPPAATPDVAAATPTVPVHMAEHFTRGVLMRDAVIAGNLDRLRQEAVWMAEHELTSNLSERWRPHVQRMQDAARAARDAADLSQGAAAVASVAAACGSCHSALGGPRVVVAAPPVGTSGAGMLMARHKWAADRMWDGLVGPSDEAWIRGAEIMADAPLAGVEGVINCCVDRAMVDRLADQVHVQAARARTVSEPTQRAREYGVFLGTCRQCHQAVSVTAAVQR